MTQNAARPTLWMLGGAISFALMGASTHALGSRCDWLIVALTRALFMLVSAVLLARSAGASLPVFRPKTLWLRSLAGSFSLVCNFYALTKLPVADALTLASMYPLWIVLISALILRQSPSIREGLGVVSGLAGVLLIQQPHLGGDKLAAIVAMVSSISTAVALLGLHQLRQVDTRAVVAHFAGVASLVSLLWLCFRPEALWTTHTDASTLALLLAVGLTGTFGQICLTRAYAVGAPTRLAVIGLSQVAFAMGLDILIWGHPLTPISLAGFVLVLAPSALLMTRAKNRIAALNASPRLDQGQGSEGEAFETAARLDLDTEADLNPITPRLGAARHLS